MNRALVMLGILTLAASQATVAAAPDPYQIYARARDVWMSQHYPPYVAYTIEVSVDEKGTEKLSHYSVLYNAERNTVAMNGVSKEEQLDPHVPTGVNMSIDPKRQWQTLFKKPVGDPEQAVDYLGVPMLAPNYSFGVAPYVPQLASSQADQAALVQEIRHEFHDPMSSEKAQELAKSQGLKEIASVTSAQRDYTITYDGIESAGTCSAYHLSLRPTRSPSVLRLREIWIDTQTYATCQVVTQGNFTTSTVSTVPWLVRFERIGGAQYITSEAAEKPVGVGRHLYDNVTIGFQNLAATNPPRFGVDPVTPTKNVLVEP
jgi:hypothetical protein